jgi:predicted component of type VI protein secretion system
MSARPNLRGSGRSPATLVGTWLAASLRDDRDERDRLAPRMNGPRPDLADDMAVVEAASEIALRRYFGEDYDVRHVTAFAELVRDSWAGRLPLSLLQIEAVIRRALGEHAVDLRGVDAAAKFRVQVLATFGASQWLSLDEEGTRALVAEAETQAINGGWKPRRADS